MHADLKRLLLVDVECIDPVQLLLQSAIELLPKTICVASWVRSVSMQLANIIAASLHVGKSYHVTAHHAQWPS